MAPQAAFAGEAALDLMSQTVPAMDKPEESMHYIRHALEADPLVIESDRDEAEPGVIASGGYRATVLRAGLIQGGRERLPGW